MKRKELTGIFVCFALLFFSAVAFAAPVPDTGQYWCLDGRDREITCLPGDRNDGGYTINPPSYTKLDGSGNVLPGSATTWVTVKDNVTGLIWDMRPNSSDIESMNDAKWGGYSDWRMPTIIELTYLVSYAGNIPAIHNYYFPNTRSFYWASTGNRGIYFENGGEAYSVGGYIRAVRGGQAGASSISLVNNSDGTVTDIDTGLMWEQNPKLVSGYGRSISDAISYCHNLSLAGYTDWRLPTIKELRSIANTASDRTTGPVFIDTNFFPNTPRSFFFSSTNYAPDHWYTWGVDFSWGGSTARYHIGYNIIDGKTYYWQARAVRGGQSQSLGHLVILNPVQSDNWTIGSEKVITWDTQSISGNVSISISRDGGKTYSVIAGDTPNAGSYPWTVTGQGSYNCMIKIEPLSDLSKVTVQGLFTVDPKLLRMHYKIT